jgi:uncharacterized SAM-binding protein YcdF (DUF218 family)
VASDAPAPDAIVVIFGAAVRPDGSPSTTLRRRVEAAAAFGTRFAAPLFIPTGGVGRYGASEASVMANLLRTFALRNATIVLEETGTDTLSSVRAVARIIRERGLSAPVYAATSRYHLPRCVLLLRIAGIRARACPPPPFPAAERLCRRWYWRLREVLALPFDLLLMAAIRLRGRA